MDAKYIALVLALVPILLVSGCTAPEVAEINSFEECIAAGYPAMESYPRQCSDGVNTFTEEACSAGGNTLTLADALQIAGAGGSGCAIAGTLKETRMCNEDTGTWWIDLEPYTPQEGCNPACVVNVATRDAEVNWRCTGLVEPMTPDGCVEAGGRTQNIVGMETPYCLENETDLGPVEGFISPNVCCIPKGEETCTMEGTDFTMDLARAEELALASECLEGAPLLEAMCNEVTGTWWIDLTLEKSGCSPACVINVETEKAEINWRCTGLLG